MGSVSDAAMMYHENLGIPHSLTITICGGGNGAHTAAVYLGSKPGLLVNVLTRQPARWSKNLLMSCAGTSWEKRGDIFGRLNQVSDDPAIIIPQADIVIIAAPASAHQSILKHISNHVSPGTLLGSVYCQGLFDYAVKQAFGDEGIKKLDAVFGLQNIPWICKAKEYGKKVQLIGPKKKLVLACQPREKAGCVSKLIASLFDIPCETITNFLSLTLTPSNQIIHPARYYGLFSMWDGKSTIPKEKIQWGLYSEMDDLSTEWLSRLDDELQAIKRGINDRFPDVDLTAVYPIGERIVKQYGCDVRDTSSLKMIFRTNLGYAGTVTPVEPSSDGQGYFPAIKSRLFWEDIPYGLCILKSIAQMLNNLPTPSIDFMIRWHQQFMGVEYLKPNSNTLNEAIINQTGTPEAFGVKSLEELVSSSRATIQ